MGNRLARVTAIAECAKRAAVHRLFPGFEFPNYRLQFLVEVLQTLHLLRKQADLFVEFVERKFCSITVNMKIWLMLLSHR